MKREVPFILMIIMIILRWGLEWIGPAEAMRLADGMKVRTCISWALDFMGLGAFGLGAVNFSRVHLNNVRKRRENWIFSAWAVILAWSYGIYGIWKSNTDPLFNAVFQVVSVSLDSTMFSLLAFYIASAAYRAFRLRNMDATIMMGFALMVMLANVPFGQFIWGTGGWLGGFIGIKDWALQIPTAAVGRAISIGVYFGGIASTWRVVLGIERRHLTQQ